MAKLALTDVRASFRGCKSLNLLCRKRGTWVENKPFGADGVMTIEGGASSGEVAEACAARGTCTPLPAVKELGYIGFALGGGAGWTSGPMGHAVD